MGFQGAEQMRNDNQGGGGWLTLDKGVPVDLIVMSYIGQKTTTEGQYKGAVQFQFEVKVDGETCKIGGSWRLLKALEPHIEAFNAPFQCTLTRKKEIVEVEKEGRKDDHLVNTYYVDNAKLAEVIDDDVEFPI